MPPLACHWSRKRWCVGLVACATRQHRNRESPGLKHRGFFHLMIGNGGIWATCPKRCKTLNYSLSNGPTWTTFQMKSTIRTRIVQHLGDKMNNESDTSTPTRPAQMDMTNFEYRLQQLESERLPRRVAEVEFITAQLQGEVTAVKEIARGIGVKLDAGIEKLSTNSTIELNKLSTEQARALSFMRGVLWLGGGLVVFVGLLVTLAPAFRKLLGD